MTNTRDGRRIKMDGQFHKLRLDGDGFDATVGH